MKDMYRPEHFRFGLFVYWGVFCRNRVGDSGLTNLSKYDSIDKCTLVRKLQFKNILEETGDCMTVETQQQPSGDICCPNCGAAINGTVFCTECGTRLPESSAPATEAEAVPVVSVEETTDTEPVPAAEPIPAPITEPQMEPTDAAPAQTQETEQTAAVDKKAEKRAQKAAKRAQKNASGGGAVSVIFSVISAILLIAFTLVFMVVYFLHTIADNVRFPSALEYGLSGARINDFMESAYPVVLSGALMVIPMVLIILLNLRRFRRVFLTFGISDVIIGVLCFPLGIYAVDILGLFPAALQDVLMAPSKVFTDLSYVFGAGWIVLGIFLICIYACINVLRRTKHA